ncbi:MAG: FAD-binding protein [Synergistaceae bacterium]|jgi:glycolate oxidase|nr:FAD-binding protein [Synergistaceae bacterium]
MSDRPGRTAYAPVTEMVVRDLEAILGASGVTVDEDKRMAYSADETLPRFERDYPADAVCFPETTEQVSAVMRYANLNLIPVTPRGAGTGLSGGAVPAHGGIVLSLERMNRIIEIDAVNRTLTTEPGVITSEITRAARERGLFYAGDPCSGDISFIGGNVAENAGGNKVIKYGATGQHVLGLEAVLPDGRVVEFGGKRRKDVTGYDFIHLITGSEGTLAVVTRIILNLLPLPRRVTDLLVPVPDIGSAVRLVSLVMTEGGIVPSSVEFMDRQSILNVEKYAGMKVPFSEDAGAYLIIQLDGMDRSSLWRDAERIGDICAGNGALEVFVAEDRSSRDRIWRIRRLVAEEEWTGSMPLLSKEDIVVPCGAIPDFMNELPTIARRHRATYNAYGHIADGNIHLTLFPEDAAGPEDLHDRSDRLRRDLYSRVESLGGALSGEHGVGLKRAAYTPMFLNEAGIDLIRSVKRAFDPNNILNPGKIVPHA